MNNLSSEELVQIHATAREARLPVVWTEKKALAHFKEKITPELVEAMARELLALREAGKEPVAWWTGPEPTPTGEIESIHDHETGSHQIPLYAAPQLTAVPEYPELLPCPVLLEPGLRLGAGIKTNTLLEALSRRAEYYARLEAMTPEEREEHDAGIASFKTLLDGAIAAAPKPEASPETFEQWLSKQSDGIDVDCGCVTTEAFYHWLRVAYNANR